jgi:hypothetical protein
MILYLDVHVANDATIYLILELCSGESLPEVEIISLLEEQIPKYKLRADTLTKFGGYENQDWFIPSPALQVDEADLKLSPDQIRETLNYFLLCSNRVSQMTKTYDDIEAVTRLLEEVCPKKYFPNLNNRWQKIFFGPCTKTKPAAVASDFVNRDFYQIHF